MPRQRITYASEYEGHPIQTDSNNNLGCIENILEGYHQRLEYMTGKHRQVSVMQLVVTPPFSLSPVLSNQAIGATLNTLKKTLANNGVEIQAGWVRETAENSTHPHYHVGIIANGSRCQSAVCIAKHIEKLMQSRSIDPEHDRGNVHYCQPNHERYNQQPLTQAELSTVIKIRRDLPNADAQLDNAFHKLSYDAKIGTQKNNSLPGRGYGFTLLK
jgi:hypothetical protein